MQESLVFWKQTAVPVLSVTVLVFEEPEIFFFLSIFKRSSGKKVDPAVSEDQKKEKHYLAEQNIFLQQSFQEKRCLNTEKFYEKE